MCTKLNICERLAQLARSIRDLKRGLLEHYRREVIRWRRRTVELHRGLLETPGALGPGLPC